MKFHRIGVVLGSAAIGTATLLTPTGPAWASTQKTATSKGADPGSFFCKTEKKAVTGTVSALENAATNALISGNWPVAQKDLLEIDKQTGKFEKEAVAGLAKAPSKVKAAFQVILKEVPSEEAAVKNSTSATQYESTEEAAMGTAFTNAAKVLSTYQTKECGAVTPTT